MPNLPAALAPLIDKRNWLCWKWETRKGKATKVPYQAANGKRALSNKSSTWTDYDTAVRAGDGYDGIGFCLLDADTPAFDLDNCRDPETEQVKACAMELVERCRSYAEITPSGRGLRVIGKGTGPNVHRKQKLGDGVTVESFRNTARYITVTGNPLPGFDLPFADLDAIMDDVVRELDESQPGTHEDGGHHARQDDEDELERTIRDGGGTRHGPTRSEQVWYVINEMFRRGYYDPAILKVLLDPNNKISEHVADQGNPERYARDQIKSAKKIELSRDEHGKPYKTQQNIRIALLKLGITLRYDRFANVTLIDGLSEFGPELEDAAVTRLWLTIERRFHFQPTKAVLFMILEDTARLNAFHPVLDYLDGLEWDGVKRIDNWLTTYAQAENTPYVRAVGRLMLIAAVRRVRQPGCKFDEMLVMENPTQGTDKSTALATLAVRDEWFCDDLPLGASAKLMIEQLSGVWLVESAELKGLKRHEIEAVKACLSRRYDRARLAYDRCVTVRPRQSVIFGTTNSAEYLRDVTGNRRFWPAKVGAFDLDKLRRDRDQLWAEAAVREKAGESIRLSRDLWPDAAGEQERRTVEDPFVELLGQVLGELEGKIKASDVWRIIDLRGGQRTQDHNARVGDAMRAIGFERVKRRFSGPKEWAYVRGETDQCIYVEYDSQFRDWVATTTEPSRENRDDDHSPF